MAAWFARVKHRPDAIEPGDKDKERRIGRVYVSRDGEITQPRTQKGDGAEIHGRPGRSGAANHDRREVSRDLG